MAFHHYRGDVAHNISLWEGKSISPYETFTGQTPSRSIKVFRVFGAETYDLQKELQDRTSYSKWKPRAWQGIYIGSSTCYASAIPLIYNPVTTHITPQIHLLYNEYFHTVNTHSSLDRDSYLERLFHTSARWLHKDEYLDKPHLFDSFWHGQEDQSNHRKRPFSSTQGIPSRGLTREF
jgi:hypothetical protein